MSSVAFDSRVGSGAFGPPIGTIQAGGGDLVPAPIAFVRSVIVLPLSSRTSMRWCSTCAVVHETERRHSRRDLRWCVEREILRVNGHHVGLRCVARGRSGCRCRRRGIGCRGLWSVLRGAGRERERESRARDDVAVHVASVGGLVRRRRRSAELGVAVKNLQRPQRAPARAGIPPPGAPNGTSAGARRSPTCWRHIA